MRPLFILAVFSLTALGLAGCADEPAPAPPAAATAEKPKTPPAPAPAATPSPPSAPTPSSESNMMPSVPSSAGKIESETKKPMMTLGPPLASPEKKKPAYMGDPNAEPVAEATPQQKIKLSTGVALPQTGPEGTLMSFSVDYEFTQDAPNATPYYWIIERTQGDSAKIPVPLTKKQGNLLTLIPQWRSNEGPFQAHLEDQNGDRVSDSVELVGQN